MTMNVDKILETLNAEGVSFILIGGMNFLLRHFPELTFDVDIWVQDNPENLSRVNRALQSLGASWGPTEATWAPIPSDSRWLQHQIMFCLTTEQGALDIFRDVRGLEGRYQECLDRAAKAATAAGCAFLGLSDTDMLRSQEALPAQEQKLQRMAKLRQAIQNAGSKG